MNTLVVVLATLALTDSIQAERPRLETRPLKLSKSRTDTLQLALKSAPSAEKKIKPLVGLSPDRPRERPR